MLILDGMEPDQFDVFSNKGLRLIATLATGALSNALLTEQLESQDILPSPSVAFEQVTETQVISLSSNMMQLKKGTRIVVGSGLNVLINDGTGAGEELVAKATHEGSPRAVNPLVCLSYTALSEAVAESGLFGHVKDAFIGTTNNRSGRLGMADDRILFLDEIGELSLALRTKLLHVLQYGDIQRMGDDRSLRIDVRVLAAMNRDSRERVLTRNFHAGLFHRLSILPLSVPSLHEYGEGVVSLAGHFCEQCRLRLGLLRMVLSPGAHSHLLNYDWPGNIHGLEYAIHQAVALARVTRAGDGAVLETQHSVLRGEDPTPQATEVVTKIP